MGGVPVEPRYDYAQTSDWVEKLSRAVGAVVPDLVSWEWSKGNRGGRARLDYTQNASIKTLVAPYAVRPAPGAPVSAPITWDEPDDPSLRPNGWTIRTLPARAAELGGPFAAAEAVAGADVAGASVATAAVAACVSLATGAGAPPQAARMSATTTISAPSPPRVGPLSRWMLRMLSPPGPSRMSFLGPTSLSR